MTCGRGALPLALPGVFSKRRRGGGRREDAGFTLVETLVATAILAVLSAGAMLALRPTTAPGASDMARFRAAYDSQRALAIEGRDTRGLRLAPGQMQVMLWRGGAWVAPGPVQDFERAVQIDMGRTGDAPQIIFHADGRTTAFVLRLADGARCTADGWAALACAP